MISLTGLSKMGELTALLRICGEPNCVNISNNAAASLVLVSANQQQLFTFFVCLVKDFTPARN